MLCESEIASKMILIYWYEGLESVICFLGYSLDNTGVDFKVRSG